MQTYDTKLEMHIKFSVVKHEAIYHLGRLGIDANNITKNCEHN
jgi:hypothetical protein